jgi:hypothetical protein
MKIVEDHVQDKESLNQMANSLIFHVLNLIDNKKREISVLTPGLSWVRDSHSYAQANTL